MRQTVYVIKSTWVQPGTNPPVEHTTQGTGGFPKLEYAFKECEFLNKKYPNVNHQPVLAPSGTELLDIIWENVY